MSLAEEIALPESRSETGKYRYLVQISQQIKEVENELHFLNTSHTCDLKH
jgi:hypothetical protein